MKGGGSRGPDPAETAEQQAKYNRDAAYDSALFNQMRQDTPWGRVYYTGGPPGDPNRRQVTELDPNLRRNLDTGIGIQGSLMDIVTGNYGKTPPTPSGTSVVDSTGAASVSTGRPKPQRSYADEKKYFETMHGRRPTPRSNRGGDNRAEVKAWDAKWKAHQERFGVSPEGEGGGRLAHLDEPWKEPNIESYGGPRQNPTGGLLDVVADSYGQPFSFDSLDPIRKTDWDSLNDVRRTIHSGAPGVDPTNWGAAPGVRGTDWDNLRRTDFSAAPGVRGTDWDNVRRSDFSRAPGVRGTDWDSVRRTDLSDAPDVRRTDWIGMPDITRTDFSGAPGVRGTDWDNLRRTDFSGMPDVRRTDWEGMHDVRRTDFSGAPEIGNTLGGVRLSDFGSLPGLDLSRAERAEDPRALLARLDRDYALGRPGDYNEATSRLERATFDRGMHLLSPELQRQEDKLALDLANRGLTGSEAAIDEGNRFADRRGRALTDLSLASVLAGRQEHGRLADLTSRNRGQIYGETMGANEFFERSREADFRRQLSAREQRAAEEMARFGQELGLGEASFGQNLALRDLYGREGAQAFSEDSALRDQLAREGAQRFGEDTSLRELLAREGAQAFSEDMRVGDTRYAQDMGLRDLYGREGAQRFGEDTALRRLLAQEGAQRFGEDSALRDQISREGAQRFAEDMRIGDTRYAQDMGLRDLFAREGAQAFGEDMRVGDTRYAQDMGLRDLFGRENAQRFGESMALRDLFGREGDREFAQDMAYRDMLTREGQTRFGQDLTARQQAAQEMMTARDRPFQELQALMGQAPLPGMPQFTPFSQYQIQSPDYMGAVNAQQQANAQRAAANSAMMGSMIGGLGKMIPGMAAKSDRRLKENVRRIGQTDAGIPIYVYNYVGNPLPFMGVMSDEVEQVIPEAVVNSNDGFQAVLYGDIR